MKATRNSLGRLVQVFLILTVGFDMSGCSRTTWKEEALLHDGSKIIVERTVSRGGRHEIGQVPPIKEQTLSFTMAGGRRIEWEDTFSEDIDGASFLPMLLDIVNGIPYIVASPMGCLSFNKWGRPNPPYVIFRNDGKEWRHITLNELPAEIKTPNLLSSAPDIEAKKRGGEVVSAEFIRQWTSEFGQPEYKTILREPIAKQGPEGCPEMIYDGHGRWLGRDWFSEQPSYEACVRFCKTKNFSDQTCPCNSIFQRK